LFSSFEVEGWSKLTGLPDRGLERNTVEATFPAAQT